MGGYRRSNCVLIGSVCVGNCQVTLKAIVNFVIVADCPRIPGGTSIADPDFTSMGSENCTFFRWISRTWQWVSRFATAPKLSSRLLFSSTHHGVDFKKRGFDQGQLLEKHLEMKEHCPLIAAAVLVGASRATRTRFITADSYKSRMVLPSLLFDIAPAMPRSS